MRYLAVALGGCLGACARQLVNLALGGFPFPWATLAINLFGSFFLTWFYTLTQERRNVHPHVRLGIGTGFVGAFTTYSTFTVDGWRLYSNGQPWGALLYVCLSVVGGLCAAWIGYRSAMRQVALRFTDDTDTNTDTTI